MQRRLAVLAATVLTTVGLSAPAAWADAGDDLTPSESAYVADMRAIDGSLDDAPVMDIVRVSYTTYHALDVGVSLPELVQIALQHQDGPTSAQARAEVRAAQRHMCGGVR